MHSNTTIKKAMLKWANRNGVPVPQGFKPLLPGWGDAADTLAYRIYDERREGGKSTPASYHRADVCEFLCPVPVKFRITPHKYDWAGELGKRIGDPGGIVWHNAGATSCTADGIHAYHRSLGWRGFAYHFLVTKEGEVIQGRPEWAIGGHTLNFGTWLGVCAEGNYERKGEGMPSAQVEACKQLHAYLHKKYKGIPDRKHKDMPGNSTACPGMNFRFYAITSL